MKYMSRLEISIQKEEPARQKTKVTLSRINLVQYRYLKNYNSRIKDK